MRVTTTASSAPATVRNTTPPVGFARDQRLPTCRCRPINSFPIKKSRLAEPRIRISETLSPSRRFTSQGSHHERTIRLPADQSRLEVDRTASPDFRSRPFLVRGLSDAAEPELLVDLRRHSFADAGGADPHRRGPGDALHAACRSRLQVGRKHRARRQLRLAVAQHARLWRIDVLFRRLYPHVPRLVLRVVQGAARSAVDSRRHYLPLDDGDWLHGLCAALG